MAALRMRGFPTVEILSQLLPPHGWSSLTSSSVDPNPVVGAEVLELATRTVAGALADFDPLRRSSTRFAIEDGEPIVGLAALMVDDPEAVNGDVIEALVTEFGEQMTVLARVVQYAIAEHRVHRGSHDQM